MIITIVFVVGCLCGAVVGGVTVWMFLRDVYGPRRLELPPAVAMPASWRQVRDATRAHRLEIDVPPRRWIREARDSFDDLAELTR
jgi:hypothetical protein